MIFPGEAAQACPGVVGLCARHPCSFTRRRWRGCSWARLLLWLVWRRGWLKRPGAIVGLFLAGYGTARFLVEFVRQADAQFITARQPAGRTAVGGCGLTMGQLLSLPMIAVGLG